MFVAMAVDHLFASFILLLICNTGSSAEMSVFVQTGDSVQLDILTQKLPEFDDLYWTNDKSESIVRYISGTKVKLHSSYKDRVDFNTETFSLTLKNMQKTDSGLYTARTTGESEIIIVTYRVSVIGTSAEISVFVQTGDSVQLDIHTQKLPEFDFLSWINDKSESIVRYISGPKEVKPHSSYKDRVDFNTETFSLTLKNMQKTDSGLYRARTTGESDKIISTYRVSVIGFSAEIFVFVQTGDSVQLDIHTQKLPEFDILSWTNDKSESIVRYISGTKVKLHSSYKDRVDFNTETFSLTLKNMQKTDSGLYTARTTGESERMIVTYRVSVIDAVEAPVLTVNSIWSSSDSCTVNLNFTCRAQDLTINSSYQNSRCSPEEVTSHENNTLTLNCSEESIICNHSNPVSSKQERIKIMKRLQ